MIPTLLTLALFSMVTASSTRLPKQKVPPWSSPSSPSGTSLATPGPGRLLIQFLLTTRFSYHMRRPYSQDMWPCGTDLVWGPLDRSPDLGSSQILPGIPSEKLVVNMPMALGKPEPGPLGARMPQWLVILS